MYVVWYVWTNSLLCCAKYKKNVSGFNYQALKSARYIEFLYLSTQLQKIRFCEAWCKRNAPFTSRAYLGILKTGQAFGSYFKRFGGNSGKSIQCTRTETVGSQPPVYFIWNKSKKISLKKTYLLQRRLLHMEWFHNHFNRTNAVLIARRQ